MKNLEIEEPSHALKMLVRCLDLRTKGRRSPLPEETLAVENRDVTNVKL